MDLNELAKKVHANSVEKGFWEGNPSNEHFLCLVISELMEAIEADRKGRFHYCKKFNNELEEIEEWTPVFGYESDYEVSNLGRVKSNDLWVWNGSVYYRKPGRILKPGIGGTGYYTVALRGKTHKVAVLVANGFLTRTDKSDFVNHIDGNKLNDNVNNLEFVSPSQNSKHAVITGLHKYSFGKLSYEDCVEIAHYKKQGINYTTIYKNKSYGVTKSGVQRICNNYQKYTDTVEFELADAFIRLLDLVGARNLNMNRINFTNIVSEKKTFTENIYSIIKDLTNNKYSLEEQVFYCLSQISRLAEILDIPLPWHVEQKMKYNKTREYKHGKKY